LQEKKKLKKNKWQELKKQNFKNIDERKKVSSRIVL